MDALAEREPAAEIGEPNAAEDMDPAESRRLAAYWKAQVDEHDELYANWHKRGDTVIRRYRDERNRTDEESQRRLNLLWSNVEIERPAIYSQVPSVIIERKFTDPDKIGRLSATMLERATKNELCHNGFHSAMRQSLMDYLLPGRAVAWVRYEPEFGESISLPVKTELNMTDAQGEITPDTEDEGDEKLESTEQQLVAESAPVDYIHWKDFYMFPANARTWAEVIAVGKRVGKSKRECIERFGKTIGSKIAADASQSVAERRSDRGAATHSLQPDQQKRIIIEVWSKTDRKVYWISTGYDHLCDIADDPLELPGFFPVPEPLSATLTNDTVIPVPDYYECQDQLIQIDELTTRIGMLSKACKVAGTYNSANRALRRLLDESVENELIPVDNWVAFAETGGVAGQISFLPLEQVVNALKVLVEVREKVLQDLDRVTGISDILRGTMDERETMGGTRLKSNNAGTRLADRQREMARYARDTVVLVAQVIAKHFSPKSLIECSGILQEMEFEGLEQPQAPPPMQPPPMIGPPPPQPGAPMPGMAPGAPPQPPQVMPPGPPPMAPPGMMAGPMQMQPSPMMVALQKISRAIGLLRDDIKRGYRIDIETDTMVAGDIAQERADAVQFVDGITKFFTAAGPIVAVQPDAAPLFGKILQFAVRKFRTGRDLESTIDEYVDKLSKSAANPVAKSDPKADAEAIKAKAAIAASEAEIARAQMETAAQQRNDERQALIDKQETELKMAERLQEHALKMAQLDREATFQREEHSRKMALLAVKEITKQAPKPGMVQ